MSKRKRPNNCTDEHLEYLDDLRESGVTNMWGAGPFLETDFDFPKKEAKQIVLYWMDSFSERHSND